MTQADSDQPLPEAHLGLTAGPRQASLPDTPDQETLRWAEHLAPLYAGLPERAPSEKLWPRILRSATRSGAKPGVWIWQAVAAAFALLSVGLGLQLASREPAAVAPSATAPATAPPEASGIVLTANLSGAAAEPGRLAFVLTTVEGGEAIRSAPATAQARGGHTYHLWVVASDHRAFVGVVSPEIVHSVPVPANIRPLLVDGARLEVSLDESSEAPFQPGLIVASGSLATL